MTSRVIGRHAVHWRARIADLRELHGGKVRDLGPAIGCSYDTIASWLWKDTSPLISTAVWVSARSGYTLENLVGPEPLAERDFAPHDGTYQHGSWPRGLREAVDLPSDNAISEWIASHTLMPSRVPCAWFYALRLPMLASAVEVVRAIGVGLDEVLERGRLPRAKAGS